jgi:hypothetical protein
MKKIKIIQQDKSIKYGKIVSVSQTPIKDPDPESDRIYWIPYNITFIDSDGRIKEGTIEPSLTNNNKYYIDEYNTIPTEKPTEKINPEENTTIPLDQLPEINL